MRLAIVLCCATVSTAIADPRAVDVEEMVRHDCAVAREPYVRALARCTDWRCGEHVRMPDVCRLRWSEPAPSLETTRTPRAFLVEILRTAEEVTD